MCCHRALNPVTPRHLLVVPVRHVVEAVEDPALTGRVMRVAAYVARSHKSCNFITSVGTPATQSVFHLHVHIIPRIEGDGLVLPWTDQSSEKEGKNAVSSRA